MQQLMVIDEQARKTFEKIEVMSHFANGGRIQIFCANGQWLNMNRDSWHPGWNWVNQKYRIHPEELKSDNK